MVRDVFDAPAIAGLKGWMGIGHGQLFRESFQGEELMIQYDTLLLVARHTRRLNPSTSTRRTVSALLT